MLRNLANEQVTKQYGGSALVLVSGGLSFASVSARGVSTCGVATDGSAYCWGDNDVAQIGDGTTTHRRTLCWCQRG